MNVQIKICGLTRVDDAEAAVAAGADALGLMFYPRSSRYLTPEQAAPIAAAVGNRARKVGVFVDPSREEVEAAIEQAQLDWLQFHGRETREFCAQFGLPFLKAFRVKDRSVLEELPHFPEAIWLLDAYVAGEPGGTGQKFNWEIARAAGALRGRLMLAGGLTPENVAAAVTEVRPWGVDVSSGVESAPGRKDTEKMQRFIAEARTAAALPGRN